MPVSDPEQVDRGFDRRELTILALITLVAAVMRLWSLGEWSFWVDEAHTFRDVTATDSRFWDSGVAHYPLAYLMLRELLDLGVLRATSEGWLRLPFAFFGILAVPALALFGRNIVGRAPALLAALFLALFPWHIYWSQNARSYALTMFLALVAASVLFKAVSVRSIWLFFVALVTGALASLSHPSGFVLLAGLVPFLVAELRRDEELRRHLFQGIILVPVVVGSVAIAVWLWPSLVTAMEKKPDTSFVHLAMTLAFFLSPPFLLAAAGGAGVLALDRQPRAFGFLSSWALGPLVVLAIVGATLTKVTAQYAIVVLPAVLLLAASLAVGVARRIRQEGALARVAQVALAAVLLVELVSYDYLYFTVQHGDRPRWRPAAMRVAREPGTKTVLTTNAPSLDYYLRRDAFWGGEEPNGATVVDVVSLEEWNIAKAGGGAEYLAEQIADAEAENRTLWVVVTIPELAEKDQDGSFELALRTRGHEILRLPVFTGPKDMSVFVFSVPLPR